MPPSNYSQHVPPARSHIVTVRYTTICTRPCRRSSGSGKRYWAVESSGGGGKGTYEEYRIVKNLYNSAFVFRW